jgi:26S proteasome regulatory subunit N2
LVKYHWHEIADALPRIEEFIGDPNFPKKELAAYVASQVFYYLEESEDALRLALDAGEKFDIREENSYVRTLLNKCLDEYMQVQQHNYENRDSPDNLIAKTH